MRAIFVLMAKNLDKCLFSLDNIKKSLSVEED